MTYPPKQPPVWAIILVITFLLWVMALISYVTVQVFS